MPSLADIRGSGDMEQDADNVIFLHRMDDVNDKSIHPDDRSLYGTVLSCKKQYIAVRMAKQRQGATGTIGIVFDPGQMRYENRGSTKGMEFLLQNTLGYANKSDVNSKQELEVTEKKRIKQLSDEEVISRLERLTPKIYQITRQAK